MQVYGFMYVHGYEYAPFMYGTSDSCDKSVTCARCDTDSMPCLRSPAIARSFTLEGGGGGGGRGDEAEEKEKDYHEEK